MAAESVAVAEAAVDKSEMERLNLRMSRKHLGAIRAAVEAGRYGSRSAAIRDAIREKYMEPGRRRRRIGSAARSRPDRGRGHDGDAWKRVTVRVPEGQVDAIDRAVERGWYPNRSEAIRAASREKFIEGHS